MPGIMDKIKNYVIVDPMSLEEEEEDVWPSRLSFILASMGGAVGVGSLIRYPSIALRNSGVQWFVPYIGSLFFVGLPILALEISVGQAYRSGDVIAFNRIHKRLRGVGLSTAFLGWTASTYYVVLMAWVFTFFRNSLSNPLPWIDKHRDFFHSSVVRNMRSLNITITAETFVSYAGGGIVWETFGWTVLTWIFVYLLLWKGVKTTRKVMCFIMLVPLIAAVAILIRAVTLKNAWRGIRMYIVEFNGYKLANGSIWQDAVVQIFYSVGICFAIFTAYASHRARYANVLQDVTIIACGNSFIEMGAAFAAFGVMGHLNYDPKTMPELSTSEVGLIMYRAAIAKLPGSNVWAAFFFIALYVLGIGSVSAYLGTFTTTVANTNWIAKIRRTFMVTICCFCAVIIPNLYTTKFGYHLMIAVDTEITQIALILIVWLECVGSTTLYRYEEVVEQTGQVAFLLAQGSYFGSMVIALIIGHTVKNIGPWIGLGIWLFLLIIGTVTAALVSEQPTAPSPWGKNKFFNSLFYITSYSGHMLSKDLNAIVAQNNNWALPKIWSPLLRWCASPILLTILSLGYSRFIKESSSDPAHIFAFITAHGFVFFFVYGIVAPNCPGWWIRDEEKDVGPSGLSLASTSMRGAFGEGFQICYSSNSLCDFVVQSFLSYIDSLRAHPLCYIAVAGVLAFGGAVFMLKRAGTKLLSPHITTTTRKIGFASDFCSARNPTSKLQSSENIWLLPLFLLILCLTICLTCLLRYRVVPAITQFARWLRVPDGVASGVLHPLASCIPKLFISLLSTLIHTNADGLAIGTNVGSAMFNILIVPVLVAIHSSAVGELSLCRMLGYGACFLLSLAVLLIAMLVSSPGHISLLEAIILLIMSAVYALAVVIASVMSRNSMAASGDHGDARNSDASSKEEGMETAAGSEGGDVEMGNADSNDLSGSNGRSSMGNSEQANGQTTSRTAQLAVSLYRWLNSGFGVLCKLLHEIVPDCSGEWNPEFPFGVLPAIPKWPFAVVIMLLGVSGICYGLTDACIRISCLLRLHSGIAGAVILAPCIGVAAVFAALPLFTNSDVESVLSYGCASSVFCILVGVGLPFFIRGLIDGTGP